MLVDTLRTKLKEAMRAGDGMRKDALRVVISEATPKDGSVANDEAVIRTIRKVVEGNTETRTKLKESGRESEPLYAKLEAESNFLSGFLPRMLNQEQIGNELMPLVDQIKGAKSEGQAIGIAMKHLKTKGYPVDGKDVSAVVVNLRK
jgi:uncharacterized protein YqeY